VFDKKAYNAHVRKAKQFAAENNLQKALEEYQAAGFEIDSCCGIVLMTCYFCSCGSSKTRRIDEEDQVAQEKDCSGRKIKEAKFKKATELAVTDFC
jgi:hypothetical protein